MAYLSNLNLFFVRSVSNIVKRISTNKYCTTTSDSNNSLKVENDMIVEMENPFIRENPKCILCKYDIEPNYKNVRLLSQFVSSYTGKILPRHVTGICAGKHKKVVTEIGKAKRAFLMPKRYKFPQYLEDPLLFDMNALSKPRRVI